jgi:hypothetical protein
MVLVRHMNANTGRANMFQRWICLLVRHWEALDIISASSNSWQGYLRNIDMSLMSIKSPISCGISIGDWKDTVQALTSYTIDTPGIRSFNADAAIKMLETEIELGDTNLHNCKIIKASKSTTSTVQEESQKLPQAMAKIIKFSAMHCEAALVSFVSNGGGTLGDCTPGKLIDLDSMFGDFLCC